MKIQLLAIIHKLEYLESQTFVKNIHAFKDLSDTHIKIIVTVLHELTNLSTQNLRITKRNVLLKMFARYWEMG